MSSSASASNYWWTCYGLVPLGRCPDCPRMASLKRLITTSDQNGNTGREFVTCESKSESGQKLPKCRHFEWLDDYIKRIGTEDASLGLNFGGGPLNLSSAVEQVGSGLVGSGAAPLEQLGSIEELKKINKLLKLVNLKK